MSIINQYCYIAGLRRDCVYDWNDGQDNKIGRLSNIKEGLISKKNDKQYAQEEAEQILINATTQDDTWKINEISKNVYSVSGYGLGYYENQLSMGEWYYYEDSKTIEARSSASIKLGDVITAKD